MSCDNLTELLTNIIDLVAFFLAAPEILGEEKLDLIVTTSNRILKNYILWIAGRGLIVLMAIYFVTALIIVAANSLYQTTSTHLIQIATFGFAGLAIMPMFFLIAITVFRSFVPSGSTKGTWLLAGAFFFVVARMLALSHALGRAC